MQSRLLFRVGMTIVLTAAIFLSIAGCGGGDGAEEPNYLAIASDTVTGSGCFQTNYAHRGELCVIRARVVDPITGLDMTDEEIESVIWKLANGENISLHYSEHGDVGDTFWASAWEVPLNFPTGTFAYTLEAVANDGRTGTYSQFLVDASVLTIVEYDPAFVARQSVNIEGNAFSKDPITVTVGGQVRWTNRDDVVHRIVGADFDTEDIAAGERVSITFDTPGTYDYSCTIHGTTSSVVVQGVS